MKSILRQRINSQAPADRGMGLLEPLLLTVMLMVAVSAMATVFNSISRSMVASQQQVNLQAEIDTSLQQIKVLARQFTCCSGYCTTSPPNCGNSDSCPNPNPPDTYNYGTVKSVLQACATNDPRDDRYYFPQTTLSNGSTKTFPSTTTALVPLAVEQLCNNNTVFMQRLLAAVKSTANVTKPTNASIGFTTNESVPADHILTVKFTSTINEGKVVRVENIIPKMANFCP